MRGFINSTIHRMNLIFDKIFVISLKRRPERLKRFSKGIDGCKWPFSYPEIFWGIDGDKVGVPRYWQTGGGSYGCLRSHLSILERAIQDDVRTLMVLEDDALLAPDFGPRATEFMNEVPADWECLMLGGQHVSSEPIPVVPKIVRAGFGGGIQRTHCYALRGIAVMRELYRTWAQCAVHCDWVMGPCMTRFNTYAPDPFLVGQAAGESDISGQSNPDKFWRPPTGREPIILLKASRTTMDELAKIGWHGGYQRDQMTGIDVGLRDIFDDASLTPIQRSSKLGQWIDTIQWEIASMIEPAICTVWHPSVEVEDLQRIVGGPIIKICANSADEALAQLPAEFRREEPLKIPVVVARVSREVMDEMRKGGFHAGYWLNDVTGADKGLEAILDQHLSEMQLTARLIFLARLLDREAVQIRSGVATLWHPNLPEIILPEDEFDVIEIRAESAFQARQTIEDREAKYAGKKSG